jgi:hypothetical protein
MSLFGPAAPSKDVLLQFNAGKMTFRDNLVSPQPARGTIILKKVS